MSTAARWDQVKIRQLIDDLVELSQRNSHNSVITDWNNTSKFITQFDNMSVSGSLSSRSHIRSARNNSHQLKQRRWREAHNSEDEDDEDDDEDDESKDVPEGGAGGAAGAVSDGGEGASHVSDALNTKPVLTTDGDYNSGSIHYVDACTLWKFPTWLVERLDCSKIIENASNLHAQQVRRTLMQQLKATSTDLIMYATVRREFLRTILVIELNNVARLLEVARNLEVSDELRSRFFASLQPCVSILEDENKSYSQAIIVLAQIMNEIYVAVCPSISFREKSSYFYNNVYCSYLVPGQVMHFTEMCCGGIVDNNWFALESKYHAMVMVTPHVFDDPKGIQRGHLRKEKYRVEAYFDLDKGRFSGFDCHFKQTIGTKLRNNVTLEHLVFNYFSKTEHYVEEKSVFLMNGPETKGNLTFAKIYHSLLKSAVL